MGYLKVETETALRTVLANIILKTGSRPAWLKENEFLGARDL